MKVQNYAAPLLVVGCILFSLGSLIVKFVPVGSYAIAFWRLLIATVVFWALMKWKKQALPKQAKTWWFAALSGIFLAFDLAFWHESIYAVGPGISTLLNSLQIFFLAGIGYFFFAEKQSKMQLFSLVLAVISVVLIASPELARNLDGVGILIGLASGAMLAGSLVMIRQVHNRESTAIFPLMFLVSLFGAIALLLPSLWFNQVNFFPPTIADWGWIAVYGVVMQCMAWGIDYFYLDKPIDLWQWCGASLTLLAIYLGSRK